MKRSCWLLTLTIGFLWFAIYALADTVPTTMSFQGRLVRPDGTPVADTNNQQLTFRLFANPTGGTALWTQTLNNATVQNGTFSVKLNFNSGYASGQNVNSVFAS